MKMTHIILHYTRDKQFRIIELVEFWLNNTKVIQFETIDDNYFEIDQADRKIKTSFRNFGFAKIETVGKEEDKAYKIVLGKRVFIKLIMYCSLNATYESFLEDSEEMIEIYNIMKTLYI